MYALDTTVPLEDVMQMRFANVVVRWSMRSATLPVRCAVRLGLRDGVPGEGKSGWTWKRPRVCAIESVVGELEHRVIR